MENKFVFSVCKTAFLSYRRKKNRKLTFYLLPSSILSFPSTAGRVFVSNFSKIYFPVGVLQFQMEEDSIGHYAAIFSKCCGHKGILDIQGLCLWNFDVVQVLLFFFFSLIFRLPDFLRDIAFLLGLSFLHKLQFAGNQSA